MIGRRQLLMFASLVAALPGRAFARAPERLPSLPSDPAVWINSDPLDTAALSGRPVLVEFWTFACSNCRATVPWMRHVYERHSASGLAVVAVHTPELPFERDPAAIRRAIAKQRIEYPVLLDAHERAWTAFGNAYWPAVHLYDAEHRWVYSAIGELHLDDARGAAFERLVAATTNGGRSRRGTS